MPRPLSALTLSLVFLLLIRYKDAYRLEMEAFVKCVIEGEKMPCGVAEGAYFRPHAFIPCCNQSPYLPEPCPISIRTKALFLTPFSHVLLYPLRPCRDPCGHGLPELHEVQRARHPLSTSHWAFRPKREPVNSH